MIKARYLGPLMLVGAVGLMTMPFNLTGGIPYADKIAHVTTYLLLTLVISRILPLWKTIVLLLLLSILTELAQTVIPNRSPQVLDAVANIAGVLIAVGISWLTKRVPRNERRLPVST